MAPWEPQWTFWDRWKSKALINLCTFEWTDSWCPSRPGRGQLLQEHGSGWPSNNTKLRSARVNWCKDFWLSFHYPKSDRRTCFTAWSHEKDSSPEIQTPPHRQHRWCQLFGNHVRSRISRETVPKKHKICGHANLQVTIEIWQIK